MCMLRASPIVILVTVEFDVVLFSLFESLSFALDRCESKSCVFSRAAEQQSSRAAEQQSSRAAEQQSSRAAEQGKRGVICAVSTRVYTSCSGGSSAAVFESTALVFFCLSFSYVYMRGRCDCSQRHRLLQNNSSERTVESDHTRFNSMSLLASDGGVLN